jgi:hypothetical protein
LIPLKDDGFDDEKVVMISSGYPFIALTENGCVFCAYGQRYQSYTFAALPLSQKRTQTY